jgi:hypothetical protein
MSPSTVPSEIFDEHVPILIIGGGPSGLFLAFMLEQLGGPCPLSPLGFSTIQLTFKLTVL